MCMVLLDLVVVVWFRFLLIGLGVSALGAPLLLIMFGVSLISSVPGLFICISSLNLGILCRSAKAMIIWSVLLALKVGLAVRPLSLLWPMDGGVLVSVGSPSCAFPVCFSKALEILLKVNPL